MAIRKRKKLRTLFLETAARQIENPKDKTHVAMLCNDMKRYMPSYLIAETCKPDEGKADLKEELTGRIAFFFPDNSPFTMADVVADWYELDKDNITLAMHKINAVSATKSQEPDRYGYVVPLLEGEYFEDIEDVNAYLHNLMFWESLLEYDEYGPMVQHIDCLTKMLYDISKECFSRTESNSDYCGSFYFRLEQSDNIVNHVKDTLIFYDRNIANMQAELARNAPHDFKAELQTHYDEIARIINESKKEYEENAYRNEMLMKQMEEFKTLIKEEESRKEYRHEQLNTVESLLEKLKHASDGDQG